MSLDQWMHLTGNVRGRFMYPCPGSWLAMSWLLAGLHSWKLSVRCSGGGWPGLGGAAVVLGQVMLVPRPDGRPLCPMFRLNYCWASWAGGGGAWGGPGDDQVATHARIKWVSNREPGRRWRSPSPGATLEQSRCGLRRRRPESLAGGKPGAV